MFEKVSRKSVHYVLALAIFLGIAVSLATLPAVSFAGQEIVTVCHKPGTSAEGTLEIGAPALAAHLAHGDYQGPCTEQQSEGCLAVDVLVPDPQTDLHSYFFRLRDLEFYPGEIIEIGMTITVVGEGEMELDVGVLNSAFGVLDSNLIETTTTGISTTSIAYTVVEDDDADGVIAAAGSIDDDVSFIVNAINFSCTAAP